LETLEERLPPGDVLGAGWTLANVSSPGERLAESIRVAGDGSGGHEASADFSFENDRIDATPSAWNLRDESSEIPLNQQDGANKEGQPTTGKDDADFNLGEDWLSDTLFNTFSIARPDETSSGYGTLNALPHLDFGPNSGGDVGPSVAPVQPAVLNPLPAAPAGATPNANPSGLISTESTSAVIPASAIPSVATPTVASAFTAANPSDGRGAILPNQLVFQLQTGQEANLGPYQALAQTYHLDLKATGIQGLYELDGAQTALAAVQPILAAQPAVRYVEAPRAVHATDTNPNDPKFQDGTTWGLNGTNGIHAPQAWDVTTGSPTTVIAIIDTGIDYNHPDLFENVWINQAEIPKSRLKNLKDVDGDGIISFWDLNNPINQGPGKITDVNGDGRIDAADILAPMVLDANGNDTGQGGWAFPGNTQDGDTAHPNDFVGWNFANNTNNPFDDNGHGTHVAGTIAAIGNNNVGVAGVNWKASLMPVKFLNASGSGSDVGAAAAIAYSIQHGARISNNSWSGGGGTTLFNAVQSTSTADFGGGRIGQVFVAAAGNNGQNSDVSPAYPAAYNLPNVLSVAAINTDGGLASFSNYGPNTIKVAAPGVNVYSTTPNNSYGFRSGTSMATPHATGVAGLVLTQNPNLTAAQVVSRIVSTTTPDPALAGKTVSGGIVNAAAALAPLSQLASPSGLIATAASSNQINLSWNDVSGETGFKIERSPNGSSGWTQIGTTAAGVTKFSDTGLAAGTTYFYRVRGTNAAGGGAYSAVVSASTLAASPVLFSDNFSGSTIGRSWLLSGGSWSQSSGTLRQTSTADDDPRKAMLVDQTYPANVVIQAKVRVDSWVNGDYARAGVGLHTDTTTGAGYNLVFHYGNGTRNQVQFLDDKVRWGNAYPFNWSLNTWYWFKMAVLKGVLYGKVWQDGTAEPSAWTFTQSGWTHRASGAPALNGGSAIHAIDNGTATVSFANVTVSKA
jgi:subtilisin family serine protease